MKILLCPDKFKGSLDARSVCAALREGILDAMPESVVESVPLADGGEGTCNLLTELAGGTRIEVEVYDPLFRRRKAHYGVSADGQTAFIEMAEASGLTLLSPEERNPLHTSTFGTGEMIADALGRNVAEIVLGIGGSATNDAGIGMATALGYVFCDTDGKPLPPVGENLIHIRHIRTEAVNRKLGSVTFVTLSDVQNPLFGPDGAAHVYGPQKGANTAAVELLDAGLRNFRRLAHKYLKQTVDFPGAGAAGGLGAGTRVFLHATIEKGIHYIMEKTELERKISDADLVITGEGKIDHQTFSGKVVAEVMGKAEKAHKRVIVVCGKSDIEEADAEARGLYRLISLVDETTSSEQAMKDAANLIRERIRREMQRFRTV